MAYTVVKGDTLTKIAAANGLTLSELYALNPDPPWGTNPDLISIGWSVNVTSTDAAPAEPGEEDYTDDAKTRYTGLPGKPEIWLKNNVWYAVYFIPGTDPPIPILYSIPTYEDVKSFFGGKTPVADRKLDNATMIATGGILMGTTDNIPEEDGDPWAGFLERMDRAAETQPWLADPEVFALHAAAWLEGREVEKWELEGTSWWQTQNERQRDWAWTIMRDPEEAKTRMEDRLAGVTQTLAELGIVLDSKVVDYIAQQIEQGHWSETKGMQQIQAVAGGQYSSYELDVGLAEVIGGANVATSTMGTQNVIDLYLEWLGPAMGQVSESEAARWATKIRELGDVAREQLVAQLKQSRLALFPEYTDESMTYRQIAAPWKNFASNIWGQTVDESSDMFLQILRANDANEAGAILRREGLDQEIGQVTQDMETDALGPEGSLRRATV